MRSTDPVRDFRFRRQHRLLKPAEFAEVFSSRQVLRGVVFALHYRDKGQAGARLGLIIPKKQAHTAILRNAIKRQARESFRLCRASLPSLDLVLRLVRPLTVEDKKGWRIEIGSLFDRLARQCQG